MESPTEEELALAILQFAMEVRKLGYSDIANGHENKFLELSDRMMRSIP